MASALVVIPNDWMEVTSELSAQEKGRLVDAMVIYAQDGDWQDLLKGNERAMFPTFKKIVDDRRALSIKRSIARQTATNADKREQTLTNDNKPEQTATNADKTKSPPHSIYNIYSLNSPSNTNTERDIDLQEKRESVERGSGGKPKKRFVPPTEAEVAAYALERGCTTFNAARFCDYYASNGWKVGKNPMKDWRATVRNWISNDAKANASGSNALVYENIDWDHTF